MDIDPAGSSTSKGWHDSKCTGLLDRGSRGEGCCVQLRGTPSNNKLTGYDQVFF